MGKTEERREIHQTFSRVVRPGMTPKQLLRAAITEHPSASKREILRAAFSAMIEIADQDPASAVTLQNFAISERPGAD